MKRLLILALSAISGVSCAKQNRIDPVAGREIIELEDGKGYILKSKSHRLPQIEISISENYFGIAQLSSDGTGVPPVMVESKDGTIAYWRMWIEDGREITVCDDDGDGLADTRFIMSLTKDPLDPPRLEDISQTFIERKPKNKNEGEPDAGKRDK